jgi:hypothetical protein
MFVVDVHRKKIRIGEFRLTKRTFRVDMFEWRMKRIVRLLLLIEMSTKMNNQLNVILQDHIVTYWTLKQNRPKANVTRTSHSTYLHDCDSRRSQPTGSFGPASVHSISIGIVCRFALNIRQERKQTIDDRKTKAMSRTELDIDGFI